MKNFFSKIFRRQFFSIFFRPKKFFSTEILLSNNILNEKKIFFRKNRKIFFPGIGKIAEKSWFLKTFFKSSFWWRKKLYDSSLKSSNSDLSNEHIYSLLCRSQSHSIIRDIIGHWPLNVSLKMYFSPKILFFKIIF